MIDLQQWRADPIRFIQTVLHDPESKQPFVLLPAERDFLQLAFSFDADGRLRYPEMVFSAPKKSGKTTLAAIFTLTLLLLYGGSYPEGTICANDEEQAQARVFTVSKRIIECSPLLRRAAKITALSISFPALDIAINAIPSDYAGAAGGNQNVATFDELWAFSTEHAERLFDEMVPPPTRKVACRLTTTYAGFSGESLLLERLYQRGLALPQVGPSLHAGDGMLMAWHREPIAPWQTQGWQAEMKRSLRPTAYARMILNQFVSPESVFVDLASWDACVQPSVRPVFADPQLPIFVGVDASTKRDTTALVACTFDKLSQSVRLVTHRVFTPRPGEPIDFARVEQTLLDWRQAFRLRRVLFDPFQMAAVAQRLQRQHMPIEEYAQTPQHLTEAVSNLFDLIQSRQLALYPDAAMRLAVSRAVISESSRGWKLDKLRQSHAIDVVVALSMAALACVQSSRAPGLRVGTLAPPYSNGRGPYYSNKVGELRSAANNGCVPGKDINTKPWLVRSP